MAILYDIEKEWTYHCKDFRVVSTGVEIVLVRSLLAESVSFQVLLQLSGPLCWILERSELKLRS